MAEDEAAFRVPLRSIELFVAHVVRQYLRPRGRFDEAVAAMRRAQEVDPSMIAERLGWVHLPARL